MKVDITNVLFLDIETVPQYENWSKVPEDKKKLWERKIKRSLDSNPDLTLEESYQEAGLYAEFGKIVCISIGAAYNKGAKTYFATESFFGDDEAKLISEFVDKCEKFTSKNQLRTLCGHNGKAFDFPFITRRLLINGMKVPYFLNVVGKKPWEINLLDTMELWKFGDMRHYVSLVILAGIFGIPSPKDDIDGSQVAKVYYEHNDLVRIATYCEKDVITTAKVFCKILSLPDFEDPQPVNDGK